MTTTGNSHTKKNNLPSSLHRGLIGDHPSLLWGGRRAGQTLTLAPSYLSSYGGFLIDHTRPNQGTSGHQAETEKGAKEYPVGQHEKPSKSRSILVITNKLSKAFTLKNLSRGTNQKSWTLIKTFIWTPLASYRTLKSRC